MTLTIESPRVYTQQGVPISVTGIAQVKIQGQNADMLRAACEQFLGKTEEQIRYVARETLEGHQRAIMASMTVEDIYKNRKKFSKKVFEVASSDLVDMGFTVVSYTIKDISDDEGYLLALGQARTSEVKRDARIGESEAKRDALIKESLADEEQKAARYVNDTDIAKAHKDFEIKKASYDMEVFTERAKADMSAALQAAKTRQQIKEEQMNVRVIEREAEIQIQKQEIQRREKELEATVRKPAEAEKYRMETLAAAHRKKVEAEAEGEAEALQLRGAAEAFAIDVKGKAEADQMALKANAYGDYQTAAKVDMVLEAMPRVGSYCIMSGGLLWNIMQIAAEVAGSVAQVKKIVMVAQGDSDIGCKKLTDEVLEIVAKIHEAVSHMTGQASSIAPVSGDSGHGSLTSRAYWFLHDVWALISFQGTILILHHFM